MTEVTKPLQITSESFAKVSSSCNHVSSVDEAGRNLLLPSSPKSTPPNGLPNATLIPAAAADASIRRFMAGFRFLELPDELQLRILSKLDARSILACRQVSVVVPCNPLRNMRRLPVCD